MTELQEFIALDREAKEKAKEAARQHEIQDEIKVSVSLALSVRAASFLYAPSLCSSFSIPLADTFFFFSLSLLASAFFDVESNFWIARKKQNKRMRRRREEKLQDCVSLFLREQDDWGQIGTHYKSCGLSLH